MEDKLNQPNASYFDALRNLSLNQVTIHGVYTATVSDEAKAVYNSLVAVQVVNTSIQKDDSKMFNSDQSTEFQTMEEKNLDVNIIAPHLNKTVGYNTRGNQSHLCLFHQSSKGNNLWFSRPTSTPVYTLKKAHSMSNIGFEKNQLQTEKNPIPLPPRDRSKSIHPQLFSTRHRRKYPLYIPQSSMKQIPFIATKYVGPAVEITEKKDFFLLNKSDGSSICSSDIRSKSPMCVPCAYDRINHSEQRAEVLSEILSSPNIASVSDDLNSKSEKAFKNSNILPINNLQVENVEHPCYKKDINTELKYLSLNSEINDSSNSQHFHQPKAFEKLNFEVTNNFFDNCSHNQNISLFSDLESTPNDVKSTTQIFSLENDHYCSDLVKQPDRTAYVPELFRQSDHVSCEDLLEFAYDKPNIYRTRGPHNGSQSDEVRIMLKVLHGQSTPESCVLALNAASWDVLTAIKLERLRSLLLIQSNPIALRNCQKILVQYGGDVIKAAAYLKSENRNVLEDKNVE